MKLQLGLETSLYMDTDPPTHCFCPCAHMASEKTIQYVIIISDENIMKCRSKFLYYGLSLKIQKQPSDE